MTIINSIAVPLSNGGVTLISPEDAPGVQLHVWHKDTAGYARAMVKDGAGWRLVRLHRFILGEEPREIDHRDRDRLNNVRGNLRPCEPWQNMGNQAKRPGGSSVFKGVAWHKASQKWMAQIRVRGRRTYLGLFDSEVEAGAAYRVAAVAARGEFEVAA